MALLLSRPKSRFEEGGIFFGVSGLHGLFQGFQACFVGNYVRSLGGEVPQHGGIGHGAPQNFQGQPGGVQGEDAGILEGLGGVHENQGPGLEILQKGFFPEGFIQEKNGVASIYLAAQMNGRIGNSVETENRCSPALGSEGRKGLGVPMIVESCGGSKELGSGETALASPTVPAYFVHEGPPYISLIYYKSIY